MANFRQGGSLGDLDRTSSQNAANRNKVIVGSIPVGRVITGIWARGALNYPYGVQTPSGQIGAFPQTMMVHGVQLVNHGASANDITSAPNAVGWIKVEHMAYTDNVFYALPAAGNIVATAFISFEMKLKMQLVVAALSDLIYSIGNAGTGVSTGAYSVSGYFEVYSAD